MTAHLQERMMLPLGPTEVLDAIPERNPARKREEKMVSQELKQRVRFDGATLEYDIVGAGEPVVLIHGALIAEAYAPLCAEQVLAARYQLVRYHRRGYAGSSRITGPFSIAQQAADCRALIRHLGIERAHIVGHSSGGLIALRLAIDAAEVVHSLVLLEPALLDVPSGSVMLEALAPSVQLYQAGKRQEAVDSFLRVAIGQRYRTFLDKLVPGAYAQAVADADSFFGVELPSLEEWSFTREEARKITQPILAVLGGESVKDWVGWPEVQARVQEWMPQAEPFVLAGSNHMLETMDPRGVATALARFFADHPMR